MPARWPAPGNRVVWWWIAAPVVAVLVCALAASLVLHSIAVKEEAAAAQKEAEARALLQERFRQLSQRIPNLRLFPGWGSADSVPFQLTQCRIESTAFTGGVSNPEISAHIRNPYATAMKPAFQVNLYDAQGHLLGSTKPAEFLSADFEPGESKEMPESFQPLAAEPAFYSVLELGEAGHGSTSAQGGGDSRPHHPGYKGLVGYCNPGVDVYLSAAPENPPVYVFTIVDPVVDMDGERYMLVRYKDGNTEYKLRDAFVFSHLYYVRENVE